jgi:hypothetical protein
VAGAGRHGHFDASQDAGLSRTSGS